MAELSLVGISHHGASLEVRERVALDPDEAADLARELAGDEGEAVCLSTCNRTELYVAGPGAEERAAGALSAADGALYRRGDDEAARHLFRVAAGLDSRVRGETEILGQVRAAYALGAPGPLHVRGAQPCIDATVAAGGVVSLHHPGWTGNLWTGGWSVAEMVRLRGYHLIEVSNHHSHSPADVQAWAAVLARRGPVAPVGAAAVDDLHRDRDFNTGWVMVKTEAVTGEAFLRALRGLAVYASTGPSAEFVARDGAIRCATDAVQVRFIDARGATRYLGTGPEAVYEPQGDEGFVRVECAGRSGGSAWSQAFWVSGPAAPSGLRPPKDQGIISP